MRKIEPFLYVIFFWLLAYGVILWRGELYWGDIGIYFYPMWHYVRESLLEGRLPQWNPYINGGQPLLGNPQMGLFYPTTLLLPLFTVERWLNLITALHLLWTGIGMVFLLRLWGLSGRSAGFGGCVWIGCTALIARAQFPPFLMAISYFPWLLYAVERLIRQPNARSIALCGGLLALCILCAHPQATYLIGLIVSIYWIIQLFGKILNKSETGRRIFVQVFSFFLIITFAFGLSALYLLSTLLVVQGSAYEHLSLQEANRFHLPWTQGLNPALPFLFGSPDKLFVGYGNYWETTAFIGIIPLLLALWRIFSRRNQPLNFYERFAAWTAFIAYWLALGRGGGLYTVAFYLVPGFRLFHDPARWLLISCLMLSVLAAFGVEQEGKETRRQGDKETKIPLTTHHSPLTLVIFLILSALYLLYPLLPTERLAQALIQGYQFRPDYPFLSHQDALPVVQQGLRVSLLWLACGFGSLWIALCFPRWRWVVLWVSFAAFQIPVIRASLPLAPKGAWQQAVAADFTSAPTSHTDVKSAATRWFHAEPWLGWRRYISYFTYDNTPDHLSKMLRTWMPNLNMLAKTSLLNGYEPVNTPRIRQLTGEVIRLLDSGDPAGEKWLRAMGVKGLIRLSPRWEARFLPLSPDTSAGAVSPALPLPCPRIGFSLRAEPVSDFSGILKRFREADHDPAKTTLVEGLPHPVIGNAGVCKVLKDTPEQLVLEVRLDRESLLVVRETLAPGWGARIEGREVPLYRADGLFRSIIVPPGQHRVEFEYQSPGFRLGIWISLGSLLVLGVVGVRRSGIGDTHARGML